MFWILNGGGTGLASVSRKPFPYINIYVCIYIFQPTFCSHARRPRKSRVLITASLRGRQGLKHCVLFQNQEGRLQFLELLPWTKDKKLESICQVLDFSQRVAGTSRLKCGCEVGCERREGWSLICSFGCDRPFVLQLKYSPVIFDFQAVGLRFRDDSAQAGKCKKKKKTRSVAAARFQDLAARLAFDSTAEEKWKGRSSAPSGRLSPGICH